MATQKEKALVVQGRTVDTSPLAQLADPTNWTRYDSESDTLVTYLGPKPVPCFAHPFGARGIYLLVDLSSFKVAGVQVEGCRRYVVAQHRRLRKTAPQKQSANPATSWPTDDRQLGIVVCQTVEAIANAWQEAVRGSTGGASRAIS